MIVEGTEALPAPRQVELFDQASAGSMRKYVAAGLALGALLLIGFCRVLS